LKYTVILFLFFCEFTFGQIPGHPKIISTREFPTVYTLSYVNLGDVTLEVTAQVINTGLYPVTTTGILWGTSQPTITNFFGKTEDGNILGQPFTSIASPLPDDASVYVVAYATTAAGTFYGKVLTARTGIVRSPYTGKAWMDMNLGATDVPKAQQLDSDTASFGHLYQWGRRRDGHQIVLPLRADGTTAASYDINGKPLTGTFFSQTIPQPSNTHPFNAPENKFITVSDGNWLSSPFDALWQGIYGYNVPCPSGFRVPYAGEFMDEVNNTFPSQNITGAFNSFLRLPVTGYRNHTNGKPVRYFSFNEGRYWTADYIGSDLGVTVAIIINTNIVQTDPTYMNVSATQRDDANRSRGYAVRCIKGEYPSGGTAYPDSYSTINSSSTGNLVAGEPASGVTQTVFVDVKTQGGSYDISTFRNNGIIFSGKGTLAANTNNQPITLTASGTPLQGTPPGSPITFTHSSFSFSFTRTVSGASSNGTAEVNSYTNVSSTGITRPETPILEGEVTQTITADVSIPGKYNIQAVNNGITFSASGTFTGTGFQPITLTASGTPITGAIDDFTINTTPSVTFSRTTHYAISNGTADVSSYVIGSKNGVIEAGNSTSATQTIRANVTKGGTYSITTGTANGINFKGNGTFTNTGIPYALNINLTASGTPINISASDDFTLNTTPSATFTRSTTANPSTNGTAKVTAYAAPSNPSIGRLMVSRPVSESGNMISIAATVSRAGTYSITTNGAGGIRFIGSGTFTTTGVLSVPLFASGTATTSTRTAGTLVYDLNTTPKTTAMFGRQIWTNVVAASSNSTAILSNFVIGNSVGTMIPGVPVSGVTQTITVNVETAGNFIITTNTVNGVIFSSTNNGTLLGLTAGPQTITLTAYGIPISAGTFTYTIDTNPGLSFERTTNQ
jgi:hypothetical protein